jgi:hypothetical protein
MTLELEADMADLSSSMTTPRRTFGKEDCACGNVRNIDCFGQLGKSGGGIRRGYNDFLSSAQQRAASPGMGRPMKYPWARSQPRVFR